MIYENMHFDKRGVIWIGDKTDPMSEKEMAFFYSRER